MPPAFGTAPAAGPAVSPEDFAHGEKLVRFEVSDGERAQAAKNWQNSMAPLYERRTGPRKVEIGDSVSPATRWEPWSVAGAQPPRANRFLRAKIAVPSLPKSGADIAYAPVSYLSEWIRTKQITSERLTNIYLERIGKYDGQLRSVITLTKDIALEQARESIAVRCMESRMAPKICWTRRRSRRPMARSRFAIACRRPTLPW
jgi:hypothetical protein